MAEKTAAPHSRYTRMSRASRTKRPLSSFRCRERQPCSRRLGIIQISAPQVRRTATSATSSAAFTGRRASSGSHSPASPLRWDATFPPLYFAHHIVVVSKSDDLHSTCGRKRDDPQRVEKKSSRRALSFIIHTFSSHGCVAMQLVVSGLQTESNKDPRVFVHQQAAVSFESPAPNPPSLHKR